MPSETAWAALGFLGQALFASRFLVQWIVSERRGVSVVPRYFWYASVAGGAVLLFYAIHRSDPVFIVGQAGGLAVYLRNIVLLRRKAA
jgi:lipid-A-disaccharide synthase-like uncharacterized protein